MNHDRGMPISLRPIKEMSMPRTPRLIIALLIAAVLTTIPLRPGTRAEDQETGAPAAGETTATPQPSTDQTPSPEELAIRQRELEKIFAEMQGDAAAEETPTAQQTPTPPTPAAEAEDDSPGFVLNFEEATISDFISAIAEDLGFAYVLSPEVGAGTVTIRMPKGKTIKRSDLFKVLLTVLELNNITAIDVGPYYKIVPAPESKHRAIPTIRGKDADLLPPGDQVVTQIIPLDYLSPDEVLNLINPLISPDSTVISQPGTNLLIMTGLASNLRRLLEIIELLDVETAQLELEIFEIEYADAGEIVSVLERIFSAQTGGAQATRAAMTRARRGTRQRALTGRGATTARGANAEVILIPDERSNSIIVFASRRDIEFIREIIAMLDVDIYVTQKTYIYYVSNAEASEMASLLGQIYTPSGQTRATRRTSQAGGTALGLGGRGVEGEVRIVADDRTNALIIVTAPVNYPHILETIKRLDIMPKQVLIEVLIVDVDIRDKSELGVQWTLRNQGTLKIGGKKYSFDGTARQNASLPSDIGFSYGLFEATRFAAFLRAYVQQSRLEVLSNPHIMVANNTEAQIEVGNEIPIVTAETTVDTNTTDPNAPRTSFNRTIQYRSTGVLLSVTPHVNEKRFVNLEISQEVSNVSASVIAGIDSPVIETRRASTSVMVRDQETLVIGGMIRRSRSPTRTGIPILSSIPLIGKLFGSSTKQREATELLIFLTPHVVATPEEGAALSLTLQDRMSLDQAFNAENILLEF
jgi:general secretion pathway protein D